MTALEAHTKGKVIFASAGPGDPELITVKAVNYLQQAEVVLADRLVSSELISKYVPASSLVINVGKQSRRGVSTPQQSINEMMVKYALMGKRVVRLKGGDASIFSNIMDELETLVIHNIPYIIIPGVTAALGAAATAGIPLTARGYSTAVRFLTYYTSDSISESYWKELALTDDTLVFYMSADTADIVVEQLIKYKIKESKKIAVIEQATTPFQNVLTSGIYDYLSIPKAALISPSLIIIGNVVALYEKFGWLGNSNARDYYFQPLTSNIIPIVNPKAKRNASRA